jgi:CRP-like cAMP-binding protein
MLSEKEISLISGDPLFRGFQFSEIRKVLFCLRAKREEYESGQSIFREGEEAQAAYLVLQGQAVLKNFSAEGRESILESFAAGEMFGEAYALSAGAVFGVDAVADGPTVLLRLSFLPLINEAECPFGKKLLGNLLLSLAEKNMRMKRKLSILSQKGLKEKILSFLASFSSKGSTAFAIPYSREEMASYLGCERSALSRLLSQMRKEGLISYKGRVFSLKKQA